MPPYKSVQTLKSASRDKVLFNICEIIIQEILFSADEDWEVFGPPALSVRLQTARDILANILTPSLLEEILNIILEKDEEVEATIRYIALQLLLVKGVNNLVVGHFPESYYSFVLEAIAESCANLRILNLKGIWVRPKDKLAFCRVIRRLEQVRHLTLRYVCEDEYLQLIGKHCRNLEVLDISGSENISEDGIYKLINNPSKSLSGYTSDICATLQIVDLGGPGASHLSPHLAAQLIHNFPNLKSLGSYEKTGKSLEILSNDYPNCKYGLLYLHDVGTNSQRLSTIAKLCPGLQMVYLDSPGSTAVIHLHILKELKEIKLHKVKWENVKSLIEKCGSNLRSLYLIKVWGQLPIIELGALCQNLIRLQLHLVSIVCSDTNHPIAFKNLKELYLYHSQVSTICAKFIINQCMSIEVLSLGDCAELTDAAIISSLMDNSLSKVQSIWFGLAENLSVRTVNALVEHCPKLGNIGNLAAWSIHPDDIDLLRLQFQLSNLDFNLHEYGPDEEMIIGL